MTNLTQFILLLPSDEQTINQIIFYGGFCIAFTATTTILAIALYTHVLFKGINDYHRIKKTSKNKIDLINFMFSLIKRLIEKWIGK
ncbi:MAG: hypothetical protein QNJ37_23460 [Crocosphaera sp.]|nr:hypothetical protein [Crocosphaera sp.]